LGVWILTTAGEDEPNWPEEKEELRLGGAAAAQYLGFIGNKWLADFDCCNTIVIFCAVEQQWRLLEPGAPRTSPSGPRQKICGGTMQDTTLFLSTLSSKWFIRESPK